MLTHKLESALLDQDGSCRDLDFESPGWDGVEALVTRLRSDFADTAVGATSADTERHCIDDPDEALSVVRRGGSAQLLFNGGQGLVAHLQLWVSDDGAGDLFVELTFFPGDVARSPSLGRLFREWADGIRILLEARRVYARYENASWTFGDTGPDSGVFMVSPPNAV